MKIPKHVGIILDGNRRFAKQLMKMPWEGHRYGLEKSREVLEWACDYKIKYLTAYVLSLENLKKRPKNELRLILHYLGMEADNILRNKNHVVSRRKINVRFIGRTHLLPVWLQNKMKQVERKTKKYKKHHLNIAVAYGGQQELVDALRAILQKGLKGVIKPAELDENIIKNNLYTNGHPSPDLIIRTGGEKRLSNFLSFQSAYSELIFLDKKWPEIAKEDFLACLEEYSQRKRRFGK